MAASKTLLAAIASPADTAQPVIDRATRLAFALDARVVLFHAAFQSYLSGRPFFDSKRLARSRGAYVAARTDELEARAAALRRNHIDASVHIVWEEPAHEAIIRAAIREDADMVLAAPHASRPDRAPTLRQTDWQLLRLSSRPVLLVRTAPMARPSGPVLVALDPSHSHDKPATLDHALTAQALDLATALGVDLHAAHCIAPGVLDPAQNTPEGRRKRRDRMLGRMRRITRRARLSGGQLHVTYGAPEIAIPKLVQKIDAQVLVMGAISRRGVQGFVIGNTAERIVSDVDCDLLVIKAPGFKVKLGRARRETIVMP